MKSTTHSVKYDILNKENKDFFIDIFMDGEHKLKLSEKKSVVGKVVKFEHCYNNNNLVGNLSFKIYGEEQHQKMFALKNIIVNKQPVDVLIGLYYVDEDDWWHSLSKEEYEQVKRKTVLHGANFGWFGTVDYEFEIYHNMKINPSNRLGAMPRMGTKGVYL